MKIKYILMMRCVDRKGIVAGVTTALNSIGANITEAHQFNDSATGHFFMRIEFEVESAYASENTIRGALTESIKRYDIDYSLRASSQRKKVLILASQLDHCLGDLMYRCYIGELKMDVVGIVSNHPKSSLRESIIGSVPYHYLPVTPVNKSQQEEKIKNIVSETGADLVILARYMQILSDDLSGFLSGRCVNIHHSSLPGFKGARPYHQAFERGVKLIGATAHYVTRDLDEGPIIDQDIEHITHADNPDDLVRKGRDIERIVLARAVSNLLDDRVFMNGTKTVVFRD